MPYQIPTKFLVVGRKRMTNRYRSYLLHLFLYRGIHAHRDTCVRLPVTLYML